MFILSPLDIKSLRSFQIVIISLLFSFHIALGQSNDENPKQETEQTHSGLTATGFLQQHFLVDNIENSPARFSIKRARLGVKGELSKNIKVNFVLGALEAPYRSPALVNGYLDYLIHPLFNLRAGQFIVPFGLEGQEAIFLNPAIERSHPTRKLNTYRMFRDIGINMYGKYSFVHYSLSIINGTGANVLENSNNKDLVLRLNFALTENFEAGLSGQVGSYETDSLDTFSRHRLAGHAEYREENNKFRLRGEFIVLVKQIETGKGQNEISFGGYLLSGYHFSDKWESIARLEYYQPDHTDETYYGLTLGSNYYISESTRLSLNGIAFTETRNLDKMNYSLTLQLQFVL